MHYKLAFPSEYVAACDLHGKEVAVTIKSVAIEEVIGSGLGRLPGVRQVALRAPREGGLNVQAEARARMQPDDVLRLTVPGNKGQLVPLSAIGNVRWVTGPVQTVRYNGYSAVRISGAAAPGFSTGEAKPERGPGRREIGHGALARRALKAMLPSLEEFPYTIRIVSDILESNGSSSMATVCGSSLSLMDAGVPVEQVNKVAEGRPHIVDMIKNDEIALVINTVEERRNAIADSRVIRTSALLARA